jgi:hypothetical protein
LTRRFIKAPTRITRCQERREEKTERLNHASHTKILTLPLMPSQTQSAGHPVEALLKPKMKLSTSMTLTQFANGYWYATELKEFAEAIGIRSAGALRKDELEPAIKLFLDSGVSRARLRDVSRPLAREMSSED